MVSGGDGQDIYTCQKEHPKGYLGKKTYNALFKQQELHHSETTLKYEIRPEKYFTDHVSKQIFEGVSINTSASSQGYLMNSKSDYKQREVARVVHVRGMSDQGGRVEGGVGNEVGGGGVRRRGSGVEDFWKKDQWLHGGATLEGSQGEGTLFPFERQVEMKERELWPSHIRFEKMEQSVAIWIVLEVAGLAWLRVKVKVQALLGLGLNTC